MKITILAIGKKHDPKIVSAIEDYTKRLGHYTDVGWNLIEAKISSAMNQEQIKREESSLLLDHIKQNDEVILLDETGEQLNSVGLAQKLQNYMNQANKNVIIIIGGSYGVNEDLMQRSNFTWSLSKLVFPHQLVRLILAEQLYRAHSILAGEKYHHI
ncbi:23S rRNA (pseudouridine(1915)-N(3))-methyltransferase RlmH [Candidatus Nomurabacteria bacterium]|nr:23S rRNA (pseudouridine(1915)-N(3))-methyltransferase RlmH [Candidatus Nomurabacteria bacterium]